MVIRNMDTFAALEFLRQHQPMTPDDELTHELIVQYGEVREYLSQHPVKDAVSLLLGSFGQGWGCGVYQIVENALLPLPTEDVVPSLIEYLGSSSKWTRFWVAQ